MVERPARLSPAIAAVALAGMMAGMMALLIPTLASACGPNTKCKLGERHYLIRMPDGHDGKTKIGAIIYAHGYRGTAQQVMSNKWFRQLHNRMGVAFIAPKSSGGDWSLPGSPSRARGEKPVDELAYFDRLLDDVARRFPVDMSKILVTGFSAGGMMVWNLACHRSEKFAGFAPISGTFWHPVPKTCTSPAASVIHMHGNDDPTVPLNGRPIGPTHQGEVPKAIAMYARYGKFGDEKDTSRGNLRCKHRSNDAGDILELCIFSGGHTFDSDYIRRAWDAFKAIGRL